MSRGHQGDKGDSKSRGQQVKGTASPRHTKSRGQQVKGTANQEDSKSRGQQVKGTASSNQPKAKSQEQEQGAKAKARARARAEARARARAGAKRRSKHLRVVKGTTSSNQQQPAKSQQPTASSQQPSICCVYWLPPLPKQKPTHQAYTSEQALIKRRGALCCKWQSFLGLHGVKKKSKPNLDPIGPRLGLQWAVSTMSIPYIYIHIFIFIWEWWHS